MQNDPELTEQEKALVNQIRRASRGGKGRIKYLEDAADLIITLKAETSALKQQLNAAQNTA